MKIELKFEIDTTKEKDQALIEKILELIEENKDRFEEELIAFVKDC